MEPNAKEVERIIKAALAEDIGTGDVTTHMLIPENATAKLAFVTREPMVMCGGWIVAKVFAKLAKDIKVRVHVAEGKHAKAGTELITVEGNARAILAGERVALNLLMRMSSIATIAARYVEAVQGTKAVILDTRKTMPGLRILDKYAVKTGGADNHRMRLDDAIVIKDNHVAMCGGITTAFKKITLENIKLLPVIVECDHLRQVEEALAAGAERILLDNMSVEELREAVRITKGRAKLEASGNVTLQSVRIVADTGVDFISVGRLTSSVQNIDIGLDIVLKN